MSIIALGALLFLQLPDEYSDALQQLRSGVETESGRIVPSVTPDTDPLPVGFKGDPAFTFAFEYLQSRKPKDKFETTAAYQDRIAKANAEPVIGNQTIADYFAFSPGEVKAHDYDADNQTASLTFAEAMEVDRPDLLYGANLEPIELASSIAPVETYNAQNGFGVSFEVSKLSSARVILACPMIVKSIAKGSKDVTEGGLQGVDSEKVFFKMPMDEAKQHLDELQPLLIGRLSKRYQEPMGLNLFSRSPTRDFTYEIHNVNLMIYFEPEVLEIYSPVTGKIYTKIPLNVKKPKPAEKKEDSDSGDGTGNGDGGGGLFPR